MAIIRKTLKKLEAQKQVINAKLMKATSESAIRRHAIEDGDNPALPLPDYTLDLAREARAKNLKPSNQNHPCQTSAVQT